MQQRRVSSRTRGKRQENRNLYGIIPRYENRKSRLNTLYNGITQVSKKGSLIELESYWQGRVALSKECQDNPNASGWFIDKTEELIDELKQNFTIVIVTHSMQQAARVSQSTAMFHLGRIVEVGPTEKMFSNPDDKRTQDYITGRFG